MGQGQGKLCRARSAIRLQLISQLLALPSHDLDIALPLASGYTFATDFVEYIRNTTPAGGEGAISLSSVGKVAANPEQSKHLETGTTRIMGLDCDFVGLRSETYTDSRIPDQVVSICLQSCDVPWLNDVHVVADPSAPRHTRGRRRPTRPDH